MSVTARAALALALAGAALLAGCGAAKPMPGVQAGRVTLALPPGDWEDLGGGEEVFGQRRMPAGVQPLQTRAVGLRGAHKELLAVLLVQGNQVNASNSVQWTGYCDEQRGVHVEDAARGSPVRIDCLRYKPWADNYDWLPTQRPALAGWLTRRKLVPTQPYAYLNYRFTNGAGAYVEVDVVADQRLLRPATHNNEQFLQAGAPALEWARQLARATRNSTGLLDGQLAVPAFPLPLPN